MRTAGLESVWPTVAIVRLPDAGGGNNVPESGGATLLIVYRNPERNPTLNPLRKIVVYDKSDEAYIVPDLVTSVTTNLRGIYRSAGCFQSARITYIAASGQPNGNERIFVNLANFPIR